MLSRALIRSIPATFARAITMRPKQDPIDVDRARRQHDAYARALSLAGLDVLRLPGDDALPDSCFVEDCAIVVNGTALITRPGAPSRRDEVDAVRSALESVVRTEETPARATLDGGDCMRVGSRIFVGRSARTNDAGVSRVREVFGPLGFEVTAIPLGDVLHLKCACSPLGDDAILLADDSIPPAAFGDVRIVRVPASETLAANALALGRTILVAAGHPKTAENLAREGFDVITLDTSEIQKADGALTCMSLLY